MTIQLPEHESAVEPAQLTVGLAEQVARTIAGISQIGYAQRALERAGWATVLFANRITVDSAIEAHLLSANDKAWWHVYAVDGTPPVWMVGARAEEENSNWMGCVEL
jgi:hypothetical protein